MPIGAIVLLSTRVPECKTFTISPAADHGPECKRKSMFDGENETLGHPHHCRVGRLGEVERYRNVGNFVPILYGALDMSWYGKTSSTGPEIES